MTKEFIALNTYWAKEHQIKEARQIFFDKGVIRRELITDELAFSWLRCKYKGINSSEIATSSLANGLRIPLSQLQKTDVALNEVWVGLFDNQGVLISYTGNSQLGQKFSKWSFGEAAIGFNGIGHSFENREKSVIIGYEHYHELLCPYISIGLPVEDQTIGIVLPLQFAEEELLHALLKIPFQTLLQSNQVIISETPYGCHFFRPDIKVFDTCFKTFKVLSETRHYLSIKADQPQDAYTLATAIHENSLRADKPFVCISGKRNAIHLEQVLAQVDFEGTLYIEDIHWLTLKQQKMINDIISCKLINSKPCDTLYNSVISVLVFEELHKKSQRELPALYGDLQNYLREVELCIPSFQEIGEQFKLYLCSEFERICSKRGIRDIAFAEDVLNMFTHYQWPEGYCELVYVVNHFIESADDLTTVRIENLPTYLKVANAESDTLFSLKDMEKQWIGRVLTLCKGNIKQSAKQLGITRTTLYKKIEEYQLNPKTED